MYISQEDNKKISANVLKEFRGWNLSQHLVNKMSIKWAWTFVQNCWVMVFLELSYFLAYSMYLSFDLPTTTLYKTGLYKDWRTSPIETFLNLAVMSYFSVTKKKDQNLEKKH